MALQKPYCPYPNRVRVGIRTVSNEIRFVGRLESFTKRPVLVSRAICFVNIFVLMRAIVTSLGDTL